MILPFFIFKKIFLYFACIYDAQHMCTGNIICLIPVKARKQLGLQMAVNHHVGDRNQILVLC